MTNRGRLALALGVVTYLVAHAFGSKLLYPVAVGLVLAVLVGWLWVRLSDRPMQLHRTLGGGDHAEGDDVRVGLRLEHQPGLPPPSVTLVEHISKLGERTTPLDRGHSRYVLRALPRGRYAFERARAVLEDSFGLARAEVELPAAVTIVVYPRLVHLERLFSEAGGRALDGRRLLLRRPAGFDLHSVREYEQGESLRKVHWRSTAKRGQLMVKELEDSPRDEVAVVLDAEATAVIGESFDVQVRAAGSILQAHARRGRRAVLVINSALRETQRVHSYDGDWRQALDLLAGAEPSGAAPLVALLDDDSSAAAQALELSVVTAALSPRLVDRLLARTLARRQVSLVFVDAPSFTGLGGSRDPALLRLQRAGVPVAVLRRGDDLAASLGAPELEVAVHA